MRTKNNLDVCIRHYLMTSEVSALEDYLDIMPRDEKGKSELTKAIDCYDIPILYSVLFEDYASLLSHHEVCYYAKKAFDIFDDSLPLIDIIHKVLDIRLSNEKSIKDEYCFDAKHHDEGMFFKVTNDQGEEVECEVLFTFENVETGKEYIVYTDNTLDDEGNTRVFASILKAIDGEHGLDPIETAEEWEMIQRILDELKQE